MRTSKNVTLKIDGVVLRKARDLAVKQNASLSQWLTDLVVHAVTAKSDFAAARQRALKRLDAGLKLGGKPLLRDEAHER